MANFSKNQLERYPLYLKYFQELEEEGVDVVSSPTIADRFGYSQEQVRKDLQAISDSHGKPKCGRSVNQLIVDLETFLGYRDLAVGVLIGVGHLGGALMNFPSFKDMGLSIEAGFDVDPSKIGSKIGGKPVYPMDELEERIKQLKASVAIICVPAEFANETVEKAVSAGIRGIWNFAPVKVDVPNEVAIEDVNLASSLAVLTHNIGRKKQRRR